MMQQKTWYAHGKLLLTGEYLVLKGARALALPIGRGQFLRVKETRHSSTPFLQWTALQPGGLWFQADYALPSLRILSTTHAGMAQKLAEILTVARRLNPTYLNGSRSFQAETQLEFDPEYGFGSSSTLVANLAAWAQIDPFQLQWTALGGSGYDIACAHASTPLFYQIVNGKPVTVSVPWNPAFRDHLYFVYLGKKQRSDKSIRIFQQKAVFDQETINRVSALGEAIVQAADLETFEHLLQEHETLLAAVLGTIPVQKKLFKNYRGTVKSLGAWGGDFVLVTTRQPFDVFQKEMASRGFSVLFSWNELILT